MVAIDMEIIDQHALPRKQRGGVMRQHRQNEEIGIAPPEIAFRAQPTSGLNRTAEAEIGKIGIDEIGCRWVKAQIALRLSQQTGDEATARPDAHRDLTAQSRSKGII